LNGNALTALPESLSGLTCLQEMWLQGNQLQTLPEALGDLPVG
jgi:Leucine-rich repeat (LRR) protein